MHLFQLMADFVCFLSGAMMERGVWLMDHVNVNAWCVAFVSMWVCVRRDLLVFTVCALTGQLVLRISTFY